MYSVTLSIILFRLMVFLLEAKILHDISIIMLTRPFDGQLELDDYLP